MEIQEERRSWIEANGKNPHEVLLRDENGDWEDDDDEENEDEDWDDDGWEDDEDEDDEEWEDDREDEFVN